MTTLIISEKPNAALRIADALSDGKIKKTTINKVSYYETTHKKEKIIVATAVGHLYGLAEKNKKGWTYPVFNVGWKPASEISKSAAFTKNYLTVLKKLAKISDKFVVATDYDVEGEVIGLNCIRFACNQKDAYRMKFSTLTKDELIKSYEKKSKHLDWPQAEAGETRHFLDFYYGINLSRALTLAVKATGSFKLLSSGRVQGPALKIIVDRELEIQKFEPVKFWQLELITNKLIAWHKKDKFWKKQEVDKIYKKIKLEKKALVKRVNTIKFLQAPPNPFDLTTLQLEAYRCFRISPKETLAIAQQLYTNGLISYPRTSSNQLPQSIGYKKILIALIKYTKLADEILKTKLHPNNGNKKDPAHPAIYPTGIQAKLSGNFSKIYDLIVKRFLSTFAQPAKRETLTIDLDVKKEIFITQGTRTLEPGWHIFYQPYVKFKEDDFPSIKEKEELKIKKINLHEKETTPPKRYTPASIIRELEKRNLGTKATRAAIIDALYQRYYVKDVPITATDLGISIVSTLQKYSPDILDEKLTRHFEEELEKIREKKKKGSKILKEAQTVLKKILKQFKKNELKIGKALLKATRITQEQASLLGPCPKCKKGTLQIRRGRFGMFVACNQYPKCKNTFSLPQNSLTKPTKKICENCKHPIVLVIKAKKRPQELCINPKCPSKLKGYSKKQLKRLEDIDSGKVKEICPKCKKGHLKVRKSVYGSFIACDAYPKCRYVEEMEKQFSKKE